MAAFLFLLIDNLGSEEYNWFQTDWSVCARGEGFLTKDKIIEAAIRCFLRKGYYATRMEDIVEEAGISKGGIYWHFKNKREIYREVIKRQIEKYSRLISELIEVGKSLKEILLEGGERLLKALMEDKEIIIAMQEFVLEGMRSKKTRGELRKLYLSHVNNLEKLLGKYGHNVNVREKARLIMACIDGLFVPAIIFEDDLKEALRSWKLFVNYVLSRGEGECKEE